MYDYHYNYVKKKYSKKQRHFSRTQTVNVTKLKRKMCVKIFGKIKIILILAIFREDSKFCDKTNMKVIGEMKDEAACQIIKIIHWSQN